MLAGAGFGVAGTSSCVTFMPCERRQRSKQQGMLIPKAQGGGAFETATEGRRDGGREA